MKYKTLPSLAQKVNITQTDSFKTCDSHSSLQILCLHLQTLHGSLFFPLFSTIQGQSVCWTGIGAAKSGKARNQKSLIRSKFLEHKRGNAFVPRSAKMMLLFLDARGFAALSCRGHWSLCLVCCLQFVFCRNVTYFRLFLVIPEYSLITHCPLLYDNKTNYELANAEM